MNNLLSLGYKFRRLDLVSNHILSASRERASQEVGVDKAPIG